MRLRPFLLVALAVALAPTAALAVGKLLPARKLFPFADIYLRAPPPERDVFILAYRLRENGGPPRTLKISLVDGERRTPLPISPDGALERLPTLEEWRGQAALEAAPGTKFNLSMQPACRLPPARELPAERLARCAAQYRAMVGKAGTLALLAPKLDRVVLFGAGGGAAILADGARRPLPLEDGQPVFEPAAWPSARAVALDRPAERLLLDAKAKARR